MRCPYCGGINSDRTSYCIHCGRNMHGVPPSNQAAPRPQQPVQPRPGQSVPSYPPQQRPVPPTSARPTVAPAQPRPVPPTPQQRPVSQPSRSQPQSPGQTNIFPQAPTASAPEPPVPFPPRTLAQLQALEQGAMAYTVVDTQVTNNRKKVVRIAYARCVGWQQVGTLLKALREQQDTRFETIIIQGVLPQDPTAYNFTNGQLQFDRNVRLGGQTLNRYQIETGNGFEADAVRIVLQE